MLLRGCSAFCAVALMGLILFVWYPASANVSDDAIVFPEFYFYEATSPHCIVEVRLHERSLVARQKSVINFLARSYESTKHWTETFAPASVDHIAFRSLYLILFQNCPHANPSPMIRDLSGATWRISPVPALISTAEEAPKLAARFLRHKNISDVKRCMVKTDFLRVVDNGPPEAKPAILVEYDELELLLVKYRMSIFDIHFLNDHADIVFGRQCASKRVLFQRLRELAAREGSSARVLLNPDFDPDPSEYLRDRGFTDQLPLAPPRDH